MHARLPLLRSPTASTNEWELATNLTFLPLSDHTLTTSMECVEMTRKRIPNY